MLGSTRLEEKRGNRDTETKTRYSRNKKIDAEDENSTKCSLISLNESKQPQPLNRMSWKSICRLENSDSVVYPIDRTSSSYRPRIVWSTSLNSHSVSLHYRMSRSYISSEFNLGSRISIWSLSSVISRRHPFISITFRSFTSIMSKSG